MLRDKTIEIFVTVDDFYKEFNEQITKFRLESKEAGSRNRACRLSDSEMISILLLFQTGQFTNFNAFYVHYVCIYMRDLFYWGFDVSQQAQRKHRNGKAFLLFLSSQR